MKIAKILFAILIAGAIGISTGFFIAEEPQIENTNSTNATEDSTNRKEVAGENEVFASILEIKEEKDGYTLKIYVPGTSLGFMTEKEQEAERKKPNFRKPITKTIKISKQEYKDSQIYHPEKKYAVIPSSWVER